MKNKANRRNVFKLFAITALAVIIGFGVTGCGEDDNGKKIEKNSGLQKKNLTISGTFPSQNGGASDAKFQATTVTTGVSAKVSSRAAIGADDYALEGLLEDGDIIFKLKGSYNTVTKTYTLSAAASFLRYSISGNFTDAGIAQTGKVTVQINNNPTDPSAGTWETYEVVVTPTKTAEITGSAHPDTETALNNGIPSNLQGIWRDPADSNFYIIVNAFSVTSYYKENGTWYEDTISFTDITNKNDIISGITAFTQEFGGMESIPWDKFNDLVNKYAVEEKGWTIYQPEDITDYSILDAAFCSTPEAQAIVSEYPLLKASSGYYYSFDREITDQDQDNYNLFGWSYSNFLYTTDEYRSFMEEFLTTTDGEYYKDLLGISVGKRISPADGDNMSQKWKDFENAAIYDFGNSAFYRWVSENDYPYNDAYSYYESEFIKSQVFDAFVEQYNGINMSDINKENTFIFTDYTLEQYDEFHRAFNDYSLSNTNIFSNGAILSAYLEGPGAVYAAALGGVTVKFYYGLEYPAMYPDEPSAEWKEQSDAYWNDYYEAMDIWAEENDYVTWNMAYRQYGLWDEMFESGYINQWIADNTREGGIIQIYSKWAMRVVSNRLEIGSYYQPLSNSAMPEDTVIDTENNVSKNQPSVNFEMPEGDLFDFTDYQSVKDLTAIEWSDMSFSR